MLEDRDLLTSAIKLKDWANYYKNKSITYYKGYMDAEYEIHLTDIFDNFWNPDSFVVLDLDESDKMLFRGNPKGLSHALYNTPDMWFIILKANGLDDPGELILDEGKIKVPSLEDLEAYLSTIYAMKNQHLDIAGELW